MTFLADANFSIWPLYSNQEMRNPVVGDLVEQGDNWYEVCEDGVYQIADRDGDMEPTRIPYQLNW